LQGFWPRVDRAGHGRPEILAFRVGEQGFVFYGRDAALSRSVPGRVHRFDCHSEPAGIKCAHEAFDKNLAAAIKAAAKMDLKATPLQTVPAELREIRQQVFGTDLLRPVESLIAFVSSPAPEKCTSKTAELLRDFVAIGYTSAAAELFQYRISDLELCRFVRCFRLSPIPHVLKSEQVGEKVGP
jgi:hypothetical protein